MALSLRTSAPLRTARGATRSALPLPRRAVLAQPRFVVRSTEVDTTGSVDGEKLMKDLQDKWDSIENKPQVALYAGGAVFALWLTSSVIGAINHVPLLPKALELIGLGYSSWFTYRYLLFKSSREELIKDVEELKSKITGN